MAARSPLLALSTCVVLTAGCADRTGGAGEVPSEDVEPQAYCLELDAGPLVELAENVGPVVAGPCGDLVYEVDPERFWHRPGIGPVTVDAQVWTTRFAPTGHLAAWKKESENGLTLADTRSGELVELPATSEFDFVPAPGTEHGADLWTCAMNTLELAGPEASAVVAEEVDCRSVHSSSGSPRVVYADEAGAVFVADLESLEVWALDDFDYQNGSPNELGFPTDDALWIDHDGRVVLHHEIYWEEDPDADADYQVIDGMRVFVDAELREDWGDEAPFTIVQTARRSAPVLLRPGGRLAAFIDGVEYTPGAGAMLSDMSLDARGWPVFADSVSDTIVRLSDGGASLETLAEGVPLTELMVSEDGAWIAHVRFHPDCVDDPEGCGSGGRTLQLWHEGEGLLPTLAAKADWELVAPTDSGHLVALANGVGGVGDELVLFDAALTPLATWPLAPMNTVRVRTTVALDDARVLVELSSSMGTLVLVDPLAAAGGHISEVEASAGVEPNRVFTSASEQSLAFVTDDGDTRRLIAGSMPSRAP